LPLIINSLYFKGRECGQHCSNPLPNWHLRQILWSAGGAELIQKYIVGIIVGRAQAAEISRSG
jgi:hypothetical protein